jgi:hypothetical protein
MKEGILMKKLLSLVIVLLLIMSLVVGCQDATAPDAPAEAETDENEPVEEAPEVTEEPTEESSEESTDAIDNTFEFSLKISENKYITLKDYEQEMNIEEFLGQPLNVNIEMLGSGSDTFEGSLVKTIDYEGLTLKLFAPETNFWLMEAYVTNQQLETFREISVGDSLTQLKATYERLEQVPDGRTDENNAAFIYKDEMNYNYLMFEIEDGTIQSIRMYHEMP